LLTPHSMFKGRHKGRPFCNLSYFLIDEMSDAVI